MVAPRRWTTHPYCATSVDSTPHSTGSRSLIAPHCSPCYRPCRAWSTSWRAPRRAAARRRSGPARNPRVRIERLRERVHAGHPLLQRHVELFVVAAPVSVGSHPPTDVDVIRRELGGQRGAPAHRGQVTAPEVTAGGVIHRVGERVAVAELDLVPDEVGIVVLDRDRSSRPWAA